MKNPIVIWVVTQGIAGTENQARGVAEALVRRLSPKGGGTIVVKRVDLALPYRLWSPTLSWGEGPGMLTPTSDAIAPPWPDVVIAGGRRAVGIARSIRRASGGHTIVAMVQHPRVAFDDFDVVAMPVHDSTMEPQSGSQFLPSPSQGEGQGGGQSLSPHPHPPSLGLGDLPPQGGGKILMTHGAPNRITPELLATARDEWRDQLAPLPGPRTAVLIGGNSRTHRLGTATMDALIAHLKALQARRGGSLMITVSRRTPKDLRERLRKAFAAGVPSPSQGEGQGGGQSQKNLASVPHPTPPPERGRGQTALPSIFLYTGDGPNPYHGFLAFADYIICTTDSTSMISDAATIGTPIEFFPLPGGSRRHDRFMAHCASLGIPGARYTPWNDADRVAEVIEKMIKERAD